MMKLALLIGIRMADQDAPPSIPWGRAPIALIAILAFVVLLDWLLRVYGRRRDVSSGSGGLRRRAGGPEALPGSRPKPRRRTTPKRRRISITPYKRVTRAGGI